MVQTGIQRSFGTRLRQLLGTTLSHPMLAFLAGLVVTTVLQSSTATGLMVAGLASDGMVALDSALAIMLGANVGTALVVQALSFDVGQVAPILILVGLLLFRLARARSHDFGRALIGLGLMLLALHHMLDLVVPLEQAPTLRWLGRVAAEPLLDVLLAAGMAWAAHSSIAVVLVAMSLAAKGAVSPEAACAMVLGANLGSAFGPVLVTMASRDSLARLVALGNLLNRALGVALGSVLLQQGARAMLAVSVDAAHAVAAFHLLFNAVLATASMPFLRCSAALLTRLIPR